MAQAETQGSTEADAGGRSGAGLFWRYWTASTVSWFGTAVTSVALPLVAVTMLHASSFEVGLLAAASYVAWIVIGLPAGVIVHRLPLRGAQIAMDLIRAAAVLSVPAAALLDVLTLTHLVLVALVIGLASVVFDVASSTFLPSIVGRDELTSRNSLTSGAAAVTNLGGPSLGGALVQFFGAAATLLFDAVSYLASAVLLRTLPAAPRRKPDGPDVSAVSLIKQGLRYVAGHEIMRPCVVGATLINTVNGALHALIPVYLVRTLDASPTMVGVLIATDGLGSLIGAALTPRLAARVGSARAVLLASTGGAATLLFLPLAREGWGLALFAVGNTGFALGVVVFSILTRTHRQTVTPPELLARVMATVRFVSWGVIPLGAVVAGLAATWFGNREALWAVSVFAFAAPVALWAGPVRRRRELA